MPTDHMRCLVAWTGDLGALEAVRKLLRAPNDTTVSWPPPHQSHQPPHQTHQHRTDNTWTWGRGHRRREGGSEMGLFVLGVGSFQGSWQGEIYLAYYA